MKRALMAILLCLVIGSIALVFWAFTYAFTQAGLPKVYLALGVVFIIALSASLLYWQKWTEKKRKK